MLRPPPWWEPLQQTLSFAHAKCNYMTSLVTASLIELVGCFATADPWYNFVTITATSQPLQRMTWNMFEEYPYYQKIMLDCCKRIIRLGKHKDTHIHTDTQTHIYTQTHIHTDTDTQTHRHTDTQTHMHIHRHRHTDIYIYIMYIYIYIYLYIYIFLVII